MNDFLMWAGGIIATGLFSLVGGVFAMIFGKMKDHANKHDELETRFDAHRLYAAENYAGKSDLKTIKDEIVGQLNRIEDKLDRKADR